jgi:hypothetical protein
MSTGFWHKTGYDIWCMAQRSLHAVTKVYYRSMSFFATVSWQTIPVCSAKVSHTNIPSCTMWFREFTKYVTKTDHKVCWHPHSIEHNTQPIAYLISKHVIPYQTRGGTCCPGVSTPKIRSFADSSITNHITWRNPTVSLIPTLLKQQHRFSARSNHISTGWVTISHKDTSQTQHHKGWKELYDTHNCLAKHH